MLLAGDKATIKLSYAFDMLAVETLLMVSLIFVAVAFVILRFTIAFTLSEEFREIGVMKAIGIRNLKIRSLYLVKLRGPFRYRRGGRPCAQLSFR